MSLKLRSVKDICLANPQEVNVFSIGITPYPSRPNSSLDLKERQLACDSLIRPIGLTGATEQPSKLLHKRVKDKTNKQAPIFHRDNPEAKDTVPP